MDKRNMKKKKKKKKRMKKKKKKLKRRRRRRCRIWHIDFTHRIKKSQPAGICYGIPKILSSYFMRTSSFLGSSSFLGLS